MPKRDPTKKKPSRRKQILVRPPGHPRHWRMTANRPKKYKRHIEHHKIGIVQAMYENLPGGFIEDKWWLYESPESFLARYGDLGPIIYCERKSYITLLIQGYYVLRVWLDAKKFCTVDMNPGLAAHLQKDFEVVAIPKSTGKKTRPFLHRIRVLTPEDMMTVLKHVAVYCGAK